MHNITIWYQASIFVEFIFCLGYCWSPCACCCLFFEKVVRRHEVKKLSWVTQLFVNLHLSFCSCQKHLKWRWFFFFVNFFSPEFCCIWRPKIWPTGSIYLAHEVCTKSLLALARCYYTGHVVLLPQIPECWSIRTGRSLKDSINT